MSKNPATIGGDFTKGLGTVRQNARLYHTPSFTDDCISFRLVHDGAFQARRGGSRHRSEQLARVADRTVLDPTIRSGLLGFRLTLDGREND